MSRVVSKLGDWACIVVSWALIATTWFERKPR